MGEIISGYPYTDEAPDNDTLAVSAWNLEQESSGGGELGPDSVTSAEIADGSIVDADVSVSANIAQSKVANLATDLGTKIDKSVLDANSVLYATADDTPAALAVAASRFVARLASGNIVAATVAEIKTLLALAIADITGLQAAIDAKEAADSDLTTIAGLSPSNDDVLQRKSGAWANRTLAQLKTDLAVAIADVSGLQAALDLKAPLASPTFSGTVTVPAPSGTTDAATKGYVDALIQGLSIKASVRVGTAAALPANTYLNGVLTGVSTGVLTVDGVQIAQGDRILVKNETTGANNGLYACTTAGAVGVAYVLTRTSDMDVDTEVPGAFTFVEEGTANTGNGYVVADEGPYTLGTTAIVWTQFSGAGQIIAGTGIDKSGNTLSLTSAAIASLALADGSVQQATYDANTVLYADSDNTPVALTVGASTVVGRIASGGIIAMSMSQLKTLLALAISDTSGLQTALDAKVDESLFDANTVLYATTNDTPVALTVGASTVVGRKASGDISAMSVAEVQALVKPPRVNTLSDVSDTFTPNVDTTDIAIINAPDANFTVAAPSGTPAIGQRLEIWIRSDGTGRVPTWNAAFISSGVATLPTAAFPAGKTVKAFFQYDTNNSKYVLMAYDPTGY